MLTNVIRLARSTVLLGTLVAAATACQEPAPPRRAPRSPVTPWVTLWSQKGPHCAFNVSWVTPGPTESIIIYGSNRSALETALKISGLASRLLDQPKLDGHPLVKARVHSGKRPGSQHPGRFPYRSSVHRFKLAVTAPYSLFYSVYDGTGFTGVSELRIPEPGGSFRAVHVGHTSATWNEKTGAFEPYPAGKVEQIAKRRPQLLLHSGDATVSVFNWQRARRETLEAFRDVLPGTVLVMSPANHDLGWPHDRRGRYTGMFATFLPYPFERGSLNYTTVFGGFRFCVLNYLDYYDSGARSELEATLKGWLESAELPVVILWGGANRNNWPKLIKIIAEYPKVRLVLGGDGGRYTKQKLAHAAWLVHNSAGWLADIRFGEQEIAIDVLRDERLRDRVRIATKAP